MTSLMTDRYNLDALHPDDPRRQVAAPRMVHDLERSSFRGLGEHEVAKLHTLRQRLWNCVSDSRRQELDRIRKSGRPGPASRFTVDHARDWAEQIAELEDRAGTAGLL